MQWNELITIESRYSRSVNLERDAASPAAIGGYVITSTAHDMVGRFADALEDPTRQRAWSITGPYGSGKSAFALFMSKVLGPRADQASQQARRLLKEQHPGTYRQLFDRRARSHVPDEGYCAILISGSFEPILTTLLDACCRDIGPYFTPGRRPKALKRLESLRRSSHAGEQVSSSEVVDLLVALAVNLRESKKARGFILVIDELGKFLEFAASYPERGDVFVLQQLAEATARETTPSLFLLTILHQSFDQYAEKLRPSARQEEI